MDTIINLDEKLVHKRGYRDYLIATTEGWEKVSGKPIKITGAESFDMFIFGSKANGDISISEKTTGLGTNTPPFCTMTEAKLDIEARLKNPQAIKVIQWMTETSPKTPYHLMNK